jgi:hypothetical protein
MSGRGGMWHTDEELYDVGRTFEEKKLNIVPIEFKEANAYVKMHHRHHNCVAGHKFSIGLSDGVEIRGVAIVGRPVARGLDDGWTLEVTRCCTDGVKNGCSKLYSAAWRACRAMGYKKLVTYTLSDESGKSLSAAGWRLVAATKGGSWSCKSRPRVDKHPLQGKLRWEVE